MAESDHPRAGNSLDPDEKLFVNPSARAMFRLTYRAVNHGHQVVELDVRDEQHRALADLIRSSEQGDQPLEIERDTIDPDTLALLRELGLLVTEAEIPSPARASVHLATLARRPRTRAEYDHTAALDASDCRLNERIWRSGHAAANIPRQWYRDSRGPLDIDADTAFVQDPTTLVTFPLKLDADGQASGAKDGSADPATRELADRIHSALCALRTGSVHPSQLSPDVFAALCDARLLVADRPDEAEAYIADRAAALSRHGYAVLRNVMNPIFAETLREYCWSLLSGGWLTKNDGQVQKRWFRHNDPVLRSVHQALVPLVSEIAKPSFTAVKATYAYLGIYERGAELTRHRDRPQCRWNLSMPLASSPHRPRARQWPIFLDIDGAVHEVALGVGDALLYAGTEIPHWREPLTDLEHCAVCFFHFVDWDFAGGLE